MLIEVHVVQQNITWKTKDRVTRTPLKSGGARLSKENFEDNKGGNEKHVNRRRIDNATNERKGTYFHVYERFRTISHVILCW